MDRTPRTETEWTARNTEARKPGGTLDQLKAGWENLKRTPCNCNGTDHTKADHAPVVN